MSIRLAFALAATLLSTAAHAQVNVDALIRKDKFGDIVMSPKGTYYAVTVPMEEGGTGLMVNGVNVSIPPDANRKIGQVQWPKRLPARIRSPATGR